MKLLNTKRSNWKQYTHVINRAELLIDVQFMIEKEEINNEINCVKKYSQTKGQDASKSNNDKWHRVKRWFVIWQKEVLGFMLGVNGLRLLTLVVSG